ncbi:hypothetical protein C7T94_14210 [Pedobacter yulinensis]|uniref:Uncharacterized protein n=1 Tax=Pedobacter yulinensis TaxID=2126353 RepID=A0A2T3HMT3_9SPHI|nr:hypothetical protein C7T94_14210 [Pedobacter yulinensis]
MNGYLIYSGFDFITFQKVKQRFKVLLSVRLPHFDLSFTSRITFGKKLSEIQKINATLMHREADKK